MRLIDADAVKTVDYSGLSYIAPNDYQGIAEYFYKQLISYQPTAYDVDKVVEQLNLSEFDLDEKPHVVLNEVVSIVKGAVKE